VAGPLLVRERHRASARVRPNVASVFGLCTAGGHRWLARHRGFAAGSDAATADVLLAGYLREATTPIGRGENSGRTLKESNIDPWLHDLGRWNGKPREFEMSGSRLPENVTDIAVLVQSAGQGTILGAVAQRIR
jgi:hypothetical protein